MKVRQILQGAVLAAFLGTMGTASATVVIVNGTAGTLFDQQGLATDILVYQSDGVTVDHNNVGVSQTGIAIVANSANLLSNTVFDSVVFDGVLLEGNNNAATGNHLAHSDQAAVVIAGNGNTVQQDVINDAAIGILEQIGAAVRKSSPDHRASRSSRR